jgi:hypothetical protein
MSYYKVCDYCGATLDPGEACTCKGSRKERGALREVSMQSAAQLPRATPNAALIEHLQRAFFTQVMSETAKNKLCGLIDCLRDEDAAHG